MQPFNRSISFQMLNLRLEGCNHITQLLDRIALLLHIVLHGALPEIIIFSGLILQAYHFILTELVDGIGSILDIFVLLCKHFDFLPCGNFEERHPAIDMVKLILVCRYVYLSSVYHRKAQFVTI